MHRVLFTTAGLALAFFAASAIADDGTRSGVSGLSSSTFCTAGSGLICQITR